MTATTVQVNSSGKLYVTSSGKVLLGSGGGSTPNIESLNVTPTTSAQTITASGNVDGYSPINVAAVTSAIDSNIVAGNIKKDVSILGVTGSYEGSGGGGGSDTVPSYQIVNGALDRRTNTYNLTGTEFSGATSIASYGLYHAFQNCSGLTGSIDLSNVVTSIASFGLGYAFQNCTGITSVDLSNVTSIENYGLYYAFQNCSGLTGSIDLSSVTSIAINGLDYAFQNCTRITSVDLSNVTSIASYGLGYAFQNCTGITSVDLSSVTSIGDYGLSYAFHNCTGITSVDLSSVTSIASFGLSYAFHNCTGITSVDLSSVTSIASFGLSYAFQDCKKLQTISFNSLKTTSFGNVNAFNVMFSSTTGSEATGGCTVHFPSNLQSTISGLTGYPTFGGNANYITLSFDLPATS